MSHAQAHRANLDVARRWLRRCAWPSVVLALLLGSAAEAAPPADADEHALIEFHLTVRPNLQIAIWLEDGEGNFVEDVLVTQSTGKLGIGNRPGEPLFLSSWRAPYGPREGVLPVWAHRRGASYPKIVFYDPAAADQASQGYHENTSSPETYFCRPLTPAEDEAIVDTMTCPSPSTFSTDKGRLLDGGTSVYPPRNDLSGVHQNDSADVALFAGLNDLDALSRATPPAGAYVVRHRLQRDAVPDGPLVAWIEVALELDENQWWDFDRDTDHTLDAAFALQHFGREFLGQPAVVFRLELDPAEVGYVATADYAGYADLYGQSGTLFPPDETISTADGSGADRLAVHASFGVTGRFGVYSHGWGSGDDACPMYTPPAVEELALEAVDFDTVRARFRVPQLPAGSEPQQLLVSWITPEVEVFDPALAKQVSDVPRICTDAGALDCVAAVPGEWLELDIDQLFGNYTYSVAIAYEDRCGNHSELAIADVTTPVQKFATIDGACFVATAAYGAGWTEELRALRYFRDAYMIDAPIARDLVRAYYAYAPVLADRIRELPPARAAARLLLRPIVHAVRAAVAARLDRATPSTSR